MRFGRMFARRASNWFIASYHNIVIPSKTTTQKTVGCGCGWWWRHDKKSKSLQVSLFFRAGKNNNNNMMWVLCTMDIFYLLPHQSLVLLLLLCCLPELVGGLSQSREAARLELRTIHAMIQL